MAYNKLGMIFVVIHTQSMGVFNWLNRDDELQTCEYYEFDPWSELSRFIENWNRLSLFGGKRNTV